MRASCAVSTSISSSGRSLTIDDRAHTVVGVLPEAFRGASFDTEILAAAGRDGTGAGRG
jgi:hypothetical protein